MSADEINILLNHIESVIELRNDGDDSYQATIRTDIDKLVAVGLDNMTSDQADRLSALLDYYDNSMEMDMANEIDEPLE